MLPQLGHAQLPNGASAGMAKLLVERQQVTAPPAPIGIKFDGQMLFMPRGMGDIPTPPMLPAHKPLDIPFTSGWPPMGIIALAIILPGTPPVTMGGFMMPIGLPTLVGNTCTPSARRLLHLRMLQTVRPP